MYVRCACDMQHTTAHCILYMHVHVYVHGPPLCMELTNMLVVREGLQDLRLHSDGLCDGLLLTLVHYLHSILTPTVLRHTLSDCAR